jgi:diguanylate cyclase (GGDEF)-like protein
VTAAGTSVQRPRASRARAIVVGRGDPIRELAALLRRHVPAVSEIEGLLDAVAEVGLSSAREPVSTVIISAECEGFEMARAVAAFRRADPVVPLVLAVRQGQEDLIAEAIAEDFEHSVVLPASAGELLSVLYELGVMETRRDSKEQPPREQPPREQPSRDQTAREVPKPETARRSAAIVDATEIPRDVVEIAIEDAMAGAHRDRTDAGRPGDASPPPKHAERPVAEAVRPDPRAPRRRTDAFRMPSAPPTPPRDGPPGDIDLVRAVLENSDLQAAALRVLRHHLGTADVRFVASPRPGEEEAVAADRRGLRQAAVACETRTHGVLLSATLDEATLSAWATWLSHWLRLEESHRELRRFAWTDELTGAGNRRAFDKVLRDAMAHALAERRTISLMCLDIDDFKRYNDDYGHHAGDEVLRETAELLRTCVRAGDHVFRIGGDEFVVVFCDASAPRKGGGAAPESVESIARRFQRAINELRLPSIGREGPGTVTVSAGVAVFPWEGHDPESLLLRADQRALESKRNGKNHITFGPGAPEPVER